MGLFDIFFKKKKEKKEEPVVENVCLKGCCSFCGIRFESYDKIKKFSNEKYHIKCFRKLKKQAAKELFR